MLIIRRKLIIAAFVDGLGGFDDEPARLVDGTFSRQAEIHNDSEGTDDPDSETESETDISNDDIDKSFYPNLSSLFHALVEYGILDYFTNVFNNERSSFDWF